jgi:hypothetical protein
MSLEQGTTSTRERAPHTDRTESAPKSAPAGHDALAEYRAAKPNASDSKLSSSNNRDFNPNSGDANSKNPQVYFNTKNLYEEVAGPIGTMQPGKKADGQKADQFGEKADQSKIDRNKKGDQYASLSRGDTLSDATEVREKGVGDDKQVSDSRSKMLESYDKNQPNAELRQRFKDTVGEFERRSDRDNLSPEEVAKTYKNVNDMLTADKAVVPAQSRANLAAQVMDQAAFPDSPQQSHYGTCAPTALEHALYQNKPSVAADIVKQVSVTGHWTAPDGKDIDVTKTGALTPRPESTGTYPQYGERSFATQITNNVLLNDGLSRSDESYVQLGKTDLDGKTPLAEGDSGERLLFRGEPIKYKDGTPVKTPGANTLDTSRTAARLGISEIRKTGDNSQDNPNIDAPRFKNAEELHNLLKGMSEKKQFPAIDTINADDPRFSGQQGTAGEGGNHDITIDSYNPETRKGNIFTWGQTGSAIKNNVPVEDLYQYSR